MGDVDVLIKDNLEFILEDIDNILNRVGRDSNDVKLIAVTKTVEPKRIEEVVDFGIENIGENRVQELEEKMRYFEDRVKYHMIGHLQTNKVKDIIDKVELIHSLDRPSLVKELNKRAKMNDIKIKTLIQVNISEEETKFGLKLEEVLPFIEKVLNYENVQIKGLMTMAPHTDDTRIIRDVFRGLFKLKEDIQARNYKNVDMDYLSMGMTNDYKIAIEEGSNMVRIGSAIFGERNY